MSTSRVKRAPAHTLVWPDQVPILTPEDFYPGGLCYPGAVPYGVLPEPGRLALNFWFAAVWHGTRMFDEHPRAGTATLAYHELQQGMTRDCGLPRALTLRSFACARSVEDCALLWNRAMARLGYETI